MTFDEIGARSGGSAIRTLELARALSARADHVPIVAAPAVPRDGAARPVPLHAFDARRPRASLAALVRSVDTVVVPFHGLVRLPFL